MLYASSGTRTDVPIFARWRRLDRLPLPRGRDPHPGVYEVADEKKQVIYVGQSARDVPTRLRQHLAAGSCVADDGVFWRMAFSRVPQADEAELIAVHLRRFGTVPSCNEATPTQRDAMRRWRERSRG